MARVRSRRQYAKMRIGERKARLTRPDRLEVAGTSPCTSSRHQEPGDRGGPGRRALSLTHHEVLGRWQLTAIRRDDDPTIGAGGDTGPLRHRKHDQRETLSGLAWLGHLVIGEHLSEIYGPHLSLGEPIRRRPGRRHEAARPELVSSWHVDGCSAPWP